jgi:hypothetical protein
LGVWVLLRDCMAHAIPSLRSIEVDPADELPVGAARIELGEGEASGQLSSLKSRPLPQGA